MPVTILNDQSGEKTLHQATTTTRLVVTTSIHKGARPSARTFARCTVRQWPTREVTKISLSELRKQRKLVCTTLPLAPLHTIDSSFAAQFHFWRLRHCQQNLRDCPDSRATICALVARGRQRHPRRHWVGRQPHRTPLFLALRPLGSRSRNLLPFMTRPQRSHRNCVHRKKLSHSSLIIKIKIPCPF